jgi:hypothetical protein
MDNFDSNAKRNFTIQMKNNSFCACLIYACPFRAMSAYLELVPDPYGVNDRDLKFMRAKTTRGEPKFTQAILGENSLKKVSINCCQLLSIQVLIPAQFLKLRNIGIQKR